MVAAAAAGPDAQCEIKERATLTPALGSTELPILALGAAGGSMSLG
jgi:hypothetical protein